MPNRTEPARPAADMNPAECGVGVRAVRAGYRSVRRGLCQVSLAISSSVAVMIGFISAAVLGLLMVPASASAQLIMSEPPAAWRGLDLTTEVGQQIPLDIPLIDADGREVTTGDLFTGDKPAVVILMYYSCPLLCPKTLQEAMKGLSELERFDVGEDYRFVAISFDPRDGVTEASLKRHAALGWYNRTKTDAIEREFRFLVGKEEDTRAIAESIGFPYRFLPESGEYSHPTVLFVVTPDGRVSTYLAGLQFPARHLRLSLIDAGEGKLGSVIDRVLLWCYHFDPSVGGYTLVAFRVMQVASIACALALGTLVGLLVLGERVRAKRRRRALEASTAGDAASDWRTGSPSVAEPYAARVTSRPAGSVSASIGSSGVGISSSGGLSSSGGISSSGGRGPGGGGSDLSFRSSPRGRAGTSGGAKA